jgi:hypothetical protein
MTKNFKVLPKIGGKHNTSHQNEWIHLKYAKELYSGVFPVRKTKDFVKIIRTYSGIFFAKLFYQS